jgi:superfamily II DNA or RNA helicase
MSGHILRPYQVEARDAIMREFETVKSTLLVMPTGTGKTQAFTAVAAEFLHKGRVLVLAHRQELIYQAVNRFVEVTGETPDIEMGELSAPDYFGDRARVVVSTIQTQISRGGRMQKNDPDDFALVIVDECHHACAESYVKTLEYYKSCPRLKILGVTATPDRADEEALGKVFETVAFDYELPDAIQDGWLVPVMQRTVEVEGLDFSQMRTTAGDLNGADLAKVMEFEQVLHGVAAPTLELTGDRKTLVFAASVAHAERLCEIFNRHQDGCAEWVCGKTPDETRIEIVKRFAEKKFRILCNVGCFTEGFDDPSIEVIVMARPTKSRSLYAQMAGRATRALPGIVDGPPTADERKAAIAASAKPNCEILDFVGNAGRHKLVSAADILGGKHSDEAVARAKKIIEKEGRELPSDVVLALEKAERQIRDEAEAKRRALVKAKAKYSTQFINPFEVFDIRPLPDRGWDTGKSLSEKQLAILRDKMGVDPSKYSYAQQRQLLNEQFRRWHLRLATMKQLNLLRKFGRPTAEDMTMEQAAAAIDALARENNWTRRAS